MKKIKDTLHEARAFFVYSGVPEFLGLESFFGKYSDCMKGKNQEEINESYGENIERLVRFDNAAKRNRIVGLLFNLYCWLAENHAKRMEKKYILDKGCVTHETFDKYIQSKDKLSPEQIRTIESHLSSCQFCKKDMEIAISLGAMKER